MSKLRGLVCRPDFLTISSNEIAKEFGKRHDNVLQDIRRILRSLNLPEDHLAGEYADERGRLYPCFRLDKRLALVLLTSYDNVSRLKVIEYFIENGGRL
ncbi:TPA: Rha family transcriptional regulator [Escherichia coli]|uniref:Rha family transcriptional regulator n=1 Tax=Escherichia coli TaxID=562 RepID=UPI0006A053D9|nr:Rha family transcriptional regulator [Escherichia coli]EFH2872222.1 hypothetical protein [Escherichia coli]EFH7367343.1 hypothetical protein [Escherichia coli]EGI7150999.1 Rha family transcriptional regulator [Escherichia coli]EHW7469824.1 Rha family transcriptional regulator [Escherichia coli]EHX8040595.1 Rha family transcriptional regulator [Escherichia coli]